MYGQEMQASPYNAGRLRPGKQLSKAGETGRTRQSRYARQCRQGSIKACRPIKERPSKVTRARKSKETTQGGHTSHSWKVREPTKAKHSMAGQGKQEKKRRDRQCKVINAGQTSHTRQL